MKVHIHTAMVATALLLSFTLGLEDSCLRGEHHKPSPGPETSMRECLLFSNSSCCYANFTEHLVSPVTTVVKTKWNLCQNLSDSCETFMKKIECFYQCSPEAAHWMNPNYPAGLLQVPVCASFCNHWFSACKDDLTCAKNWLTDFKWDKDSNHCQHECVPFSKMYTNGTDLCHSMWGQSFIESSSSCRCLQMDDQDTVVLPFILHADSKSSNSESDVEKSCQEALLGHKKLSTSEKE
ncbi:riboflavin-binding protein-like [Scleropages formosus]|nr:riboflavin-binding protein-like [Scleropages formosus]